MVHLLSYFEIATPISRILMFSLVACKPNGSLLLSFLGFLGLFNRCIQIGLPFFIFEYIDAPIAII